MSQKSSTSSNSEMDESATMSLDRLPAPGRRGPRVFPPFQDEPSLADTRVTGLLDRGARFEGKLTFEGVVRIGGEFYGEIFTQDTLVIHPGARVFADVEADVVVISGHFEGNMSARRRVIMHPPASFKGSVTTPSLRIDEGVTFEGASRMPDPVSTEVKARRSPAPTMEP
ncbi:MAG TPA: polymer-forming cytoskeletal protein [Pseudobdellovibrionaceae bacterium]|nr:polymer-forming cytoskeletal protein [Pseudobdellovibrionaceae bacterium]